MNVRTSILATLCILATLLSLAENFEGRISVVLTRGTDKQTFLYTIATNQVRIERGETNQLYAKNIVSLETGNLTLIFPNNRTFVRLKTDGGTTATMPMEQSELKATKDTTNLLGYVCTRYEFKQRGQVMEIWATDKLLPFQPYLQNQRPGFGLRAMEGSWDELLKARRLFPLLVISKSENGSERMRFEVKSIQPGKIEEKDGSLFQPPSDYHELEPLSF